MGLGEDCGELGCMPSPKGETTPQTQRDVTM